MTESDSEIVLRVCSGDREAFGALVQKYERRLFGLMVVMVRQPAAAEELAQDAFVRAYQRLDRYDPGRPFYPWLATIAVRLSQNWLRAQRRSFHGSAVQPQEPSIGPRALAELVLDERGRALRRAVFGLPSGQRTAVVLFYLDDMSIDDIARALGVSNGTVKTLLFRARRRLRERLAASDLFREDTGT